MCSRVVPPGLLCLLAIAKTTCPYFRKIPNAFEKLCVFFQLTYGIVWKEVWKAVNLFFAYSELIPHTNMVDRVLPVKTAIRVVHPTAKVLQCLQFAAYKHRTQRRINQETPFINHPINVATILATEGGVTDENMLMAALLHDIVECTDVTIEEIKINFGAEVSELVRELTIDKALGKYGRKLAQIENAESASYKAKLLMLADKLDNMRSLIEQRPKRWTDERVEQYFEWTKDVIENLRGTNESLEKQIDLLFKQQNLL